MSFQLVGCDTPAAVGAAYVVLGAGLRTLRLHINLPEGTQRTCGEGRIRMSRTDGILFTRIRHDTTMGLPGYVFTIEDAAVSGAKGANGTIPIDHSKRSGIPLGFAAPEMESVKAMWAGLHTMYMRHRSPSFRVNPTIWAPTAPTGELCMSGLAGSKRERDDDTDGVPEGFVFQVPTGKGVCGYAVIAPMPPPRFTPEAVKSQLGVLPGRKYGLLKAGATVESDLTPGRMVCLTDLSDAPAGIPSYSLSLFVDGVEAGILNGVTNLLEAVEAKLQSSHVTVTSCVVLSPTDDLVGPIRGDATPCQRRAAVVAAGNSIKARVAGIVANRTGRGTTLWRVGGGLATSSVYASLSVGGGHCGGSTAFPTALANRFHLRELAAPYFCDTTQCRSCPAGKEETLAWPFSLNYALCDGVSTNINLPKGSAEGPMYVPSASDARDMLSPGLLAAAASHNSLHTPSESKEAMLFLGTGSAVPSKYRNVSGLVVDSVVQGGEVMRVVCDFGEGSLGQWATCIPRTDAALPLGPEVLSVRAVFLSHSHADHVLGIFSLIDYRQRMQEASTNIKPLLVLCPADMITFFEDMCPVILTNPSRTTLHVLQPDADRAHIQAAVASTPSSQQHIFLVQTNSPTDQYLPPRNADAVLLDPRSLPQIDTFVKAFDVVGEVPSYTMTVLPVDHPAYAHAMCMRATGGWSWCYSGDGRPSPLLGKVARTAPYAPLDVLVHECTFDDTLTAEAESKKHSTLSEAISVGKMAGTRHVLLNHFSQRYPKIPHAASQPSPDRAEYTFSFDGLYVRYAEGIVTGDLARRLPLFGQLLEEYDSWKMGTSQRLRGGVTK